MVLPAVARRYRPFPPEDPWAVELRALRERSVAVVVAKLRGAHTTCPGAGIVSSGRALWLPPRPGRGDPLEDLAIRLDAAAFRLAQGRGALDLAIGEALDLLFALERLKTLGWNRQVDFARQRLGTSTRSMYGFLELARTVKDLPALRLAVLRGEIAPLKARAIAPALRKEPERSEFFLHAAKTRTLPEIEDILAELEEEAPKDPIVFRSRLLRMSAEMQEHLDRATGLAKKVVGHGKSRFAYEESIAMEFLAAHAELVPEPQEEKRSPRRTGSLPPSPRDRERLLGEWEGRDTREIEEALRFLLLDAKDLTTGEPLSTEDPGELEDRILDFLAFRKQWDEPLGRILETISTLRLFTFFGYRSFALYARERLGISERSARQRVWLERRMAELPELRMAMRTGLLTYSKLLLAANGATPENVRDRIREAAETSWKQMERKTTEEEDRQNLAAGIRRIWGPEVCMETIEAAIAVAKEVIFRKTGLHITDGEALGVVAAHFEDEWRDPVRRKRLSPLRRKVLARTKGICANPTCSNPVDHMHHIIYRSKEGPDHEWNLAGLCFTCHRRIHKGEMTLSGRAGERLVWRIWRGKGRWEVWETLGDDDVRSLGEISMLDGFGAG